MIISIMQRSARLRIMVTRMASKIRKSMRGENGERGQGKAAEQGKQQVEKAC
jgi:hypothetical protein